jgi:DNA-binding response OmpR family regulator
VVLPCTAQDLVSLIEQTLVVHSPHRVRAGEMWLDTESRRLQMNGNLYQLRPLGSRILARLMTHAGEVVPRDELFRRVWDMDDGDRTRALDVHISYLRHKLEADPRNPEIIHTERGVGYWLEPPG